MHRVFQENQRKARIAARMISHVDRARGKANARVHHQAMTAFADVAKNRVKSHDFEVADSIGALGEARVVIPEMQHGFRLEWQHGH